MLDDPMLAGRAATLIREEGVNAEWAVRRAGEELSHLFDEAEDHYLRERKLDVADVTGRLRLNLRPAVRRPAGDLPHGGGPAHPRGRRAGPVARRPGGLAAGRRLRHRRRQLDLPHGHPRALAARPGRRRPARRERAARCRHDGGRRWDDGRGAGRPVGRGARAARRAAHAPHRLRALARRVPAAAGRHAGRRPHPARGEPRAARGGRDRAAVRRRGRRPVPLRVPAREPRRRHAGRRRRGGPVPRPTAASSRPWRRAP